MSEFKVGDEAWLARWTPRQVTETCPVCAGNRSVTVLLGSGTPVITPCDYCGKGFEGPRGYVVEYAHEPKAERVRVREVRAQEDAAGRSIEYIVGEGCLARPGEDLFPDEASALAAAKVKAAAAEDDADERRRYRKNHAPRSASWVVGYHMREAKEHRRLIAYHEERAAILKARAKAVTP
jgi:hypothetical protein